MRLLSLFSGLGGFDLAAEAVGWKVAGQVEIDPFCLAILQKHWPNVKKMTDVKYVEGNEFGKIDIICAGVPCQPISQAGKRLGKADPRWLWPDTIRIIGTARPRWFICENPVGLLSMEGGLLFDSLLLGMEEQNYEIQPFIIPAAACGAPHQRQRVWIVGRLADIRRERRDERRGQGLRQDKQEAAGTDAQNGGGSRSDAANAPLGGRREERTDARRASGGIGTKGSGGMRLAKRALWGRPWQDVAWETCWEDAPRAGDDRVDDGPAPRVYGPDRISEAAHRRERLKACGNAIVAQVAVEIMKAIKNT